MFAFKTSSRWLLGVPIAPAAPQGRAPRARGCQVWGTGSAAAPLVVPALCPWGLASRVPRSHDTVFPRCCCSSCGSRVGSCEGAGRQGRAGLPQAAGNAGAEEGFPAPAQLPKRPFIWQLMQKNKSAEQSWFSLAHFGMLLLCSCQIHFAGSLEQGLSHCLCCRRAGPSLRRRQAARSSGPAAPTACTHPHPPLLLCLHSRGAAAVPRAQGLEGFHLLGHFCGVQPSQTSNKAVCLLTS